jgi:hypothetical protein
VCGDRAADQPQAGTPQPPQTERHRDRVQVEVEVEVGGDAARRVDKRTRQCHLLAWHRLGCLRHPLQRHDDRHQGEHPVRRFAQPQTNRRPSHHDHAQESDSPKFQPTIRGDHGGCEQGGKHTGRI